MTFSELDDYERDQVQQELLKDIRVRRLTFTDPADEEIFDSSYLQVLSDWGIMCKHPYYAVQPIPHTQGYRCRVCSCAVLWPSAQRRMAEGE